MRAAPKHKRPRASEPPQNKKVFIPVPVVCLVVLLCFVCVCPPLFFPLIFLRVCFVFDVFFRHFALRVCCVFDVFFRAGWVDGERVGCMDGVYMYRYNICIGIIYVYVYMCIGVRVQGGIRHRVRGHQQEAQGQNALRA